jgi:hypothetical protein
VPAERLDEKYILHAIGHGRHFIAFEFLGFAAGFQFSTAAGEKIYGMGDGFSAAEAVFQIHAPEKALLRLIHDGKIVAEREGIELVFPAAEPGVYRAEAYKDGKIWIISNPIYWDKS